MLPSFEIENRSIDWSDKDVIIFLNGRLSGIILSDSKIENVSVTPGTTFKRYIGKTTDFHDLRVVESAQGEGLGALKGYHIAVEKGEIIKGLILKDNRLIGIISGNREFKQKRKKAIKKNLTVSKRKFRDIEDKIHAKSERKQINFEFKKPYIFIKTSLPIMSPNVVGTDRIINLFAKGFKFRSNENNLVNIMIDSKLVHKKSRIRQDGTIQAQLKIPQELLNGKHIIKISQKTNRGNIEATESFVKAGIDEFEQNVDWKIHSKI